MQICNFVLSLNQQQKVIEMLETERLKIDSYKDDIKKLREMAKIFEETNNLNGGYYTDMISEINSQIDHCYDCIKNLDKICQQKEK